MTVAELIAELQKLPPEYPVFRDNGDYRDDWHEVEKVEVSHRSTLGTPVGVYLE